MAAEVTVKLPTCCTAVELQAFKLLVEAGNQVEKEGLAYRIAKAEVLSFAWVEERLVGVAAGKRNALHRRTVFARAVSPLPKDDFHLEFGWLYVNPVFRGQGIGEAIMDKTLAEMASGGVFATIRMENARAQAMHDKRGFRRVGKPYAGREQGSLIELWLRDPQELMM